TYSCGLASGAILAATYSSGSLLKVTGVVGTIATLPTANLNGNVQWNCTSQTAADGLFLAVASGGTQTIGGDFTIISTGSGSLSNGGTTTRNLTIGGNFNMQGGTYHPSSGAATPAIVITGNYVQSGGTFQPMSSTGVT